MADLDEELLGQEEEEENRRQALEEQNQQQRLAQQQQRGSPTDRIRGALENQAKQAANKAVKKVAKKAAARVIMATSPYWGPVLLIILVIAALIGFVVIIPPALCNSGGLTQLTTQVVGSLATFSDFCAPFKLKGGLSGGGGATGSTPLDITITSGYRPGSIVVGTGRLSAHSRGEAVDIALRNPAVTTGSTDPRISQLVQIARAAGFTPAAGFTLDEYTTPTEGASAGHIHVEFNLQSDGKTYCDNTLVPIDPGTSDPRVRPCMLNLVESIFYSAGYGP